MDYESKNYNTVRLQDQKKPIGIQGRSAKQPSKTAKRSGTAQTVWETLSAIDPTKAVKELPNGLKYIPWSQAWKMLKERYPEAREEITEFPEYECDRDGHWYATGRTVDYRKTSAGVEVEVSVIIDGKRYTCRRPVCASAGDGYANRALLNPSYSDINTAQMRCLVKALAMAGLGLNLYYGEDFEETDASHQPESNIESSSRAASRDHVGASSMPIGNEQKQPASNRNHQLRGIDGILAAGKSTLFKRRNGQLISATDLLLSAYAERQRAKSNGGQVGECYAMYRQIAKDKNYQELFKRLSEALGLKAC